MGAKQKLNSAYFMGSGVVAGLIGILTGSFTIFVFAFFVLAALEAYAGNIRR